MDRSTPSLADAPYMGWFWVCPIYLGPLTDREPIVCARWWWLEWLFSLCMGAEALRIFLTTVMLPDYEPSFMVRVTARRDGQPLTEKDHG